MSFFDSMKKSFKNSEEIFSYRYSTVKQILIICWFLFFLDYFLIINDFYYDLLIGSLPFVYFAFLISSYFYLCFFISKILKWFPKIILFILYIIILLLISILTIPFVLPKSFIPINF